MNLGGIEVNGVADDLGQGKAKETTFPPFAISSRTSRSYESGMSVGGIEVGGVMDDLGQGKTIERISTRYTCFPKITFLLIGMSFGGIENSGVIDDPGQG